VTERGKRTSGFEREPGFVIELTREALERLPGAAKSIGERVQKVVPGCCAAFYVVLRHRAR